MIKCNGKDIIPRLNGKELSRVMYNGKQIYPANESDNYPYEMTLEAPVDNDQTNFHSNYYIVLGSVKAKDGSAVDSGYFQCMARWHGTDDPFVELYNTLAPNGEIPAMGAVTTHNKKLNVGDTYDIYFNYTVGDNTDIRARSKTILVHVIAD